MLNLPAYIVSRHYPPCLYPAAICNMLSRCDRALRDHAEQAVQHVLAGSKPVHVNPARRGGTTYLQAYAIAQNAIHGE